MALPRWLFSVFLTLLATSCASGDRPLVFAGDSKHLPVHVSEPGYVVVRYDVGADGLVSKVEALESQPDDRYVEHALTLVSGWRFQPARRANIAIVSRGVVSKLTFALEDSAARSK